MMAFTRKARKHLGTSVSMRNKSQRVYNNGTLMMGWVSW